MSAGDIEAEAAIQSDVSPLLQKIVVNRAKILAG